MSIEKGSNGRMPDERTLVYSAINFMKLRLDEQDPCVVRPIQTFMKMWGDDWRSTARQKFAQYEEQK